jgi:DNA polymerase III subunit epsilon
VFAIIDIETTGGYSASHKITEIAILIHDGEKVVETFQTLINPEKYISPHITMLTGITNDMVKNAPKFYEVAKEIYLLTEDKIFVAHNVNFDYSFIREEFKSLGAEFNRKRLCTVRLARKIFPGYRSYSLGNICSSLGITIKNRHRAMGDAEATTILFSKMIENDKEQLILKSSKGIISEGNLPSNLPAEVYRNLPQETGVYYFHDEKGKVIYVGKAINIKKRIQSHFTGPKGSRLSFLDKIHNITFELTGTELIAFLFESHEVKRLWPLYNRQLKTSRGSHILTEYFDGNGVHRLGIVRHNKKFSSLTSFKNFTEGRNWLFSVCEENELCPKCCGLQLVQSECFDFKLKKCRGICAGQEPAEAYNARVKTALETSLGKLETHIIEGRGRNENEKSVVLIDKGEYKGFGYTTVETSAQTVEEAAKIISPYHDNTDTRRILNWYLNSIHTESFPDEDLPAQAPERIGETG